MAALARAAALAPEHAEVRLALAVLSARTRRALELSSGVIRFAGR